ncbi:MAG: T9SS type A sorting domain-containing protein [Bacteroidota bacterium]
MKIIIKKQFIFMSIILALSGICSAQTYNYYFGNIHAHSSFSDGNKDSDTSLLTTPLQDFNYAKSSQHIDFYGISDHNHLSAGMLSPAYFHQGIADANAATINGSFVALYGMEWGVISGGGHVIIYGYDSLIGWDENDYDVFVAKNDYTNLWKKINQKQGAFAYLAHPATGDYENILSNPVNLIADNAIVGMAARSGPAFSTNTTYSNPPSGNNISDYNNALKQGYHLGVGLDHDTHNSVFGRQTSGRLVVLATSLTRNTILEAFRKMRFYSSDDWNVKVNFTISNQSMGSVLTRAGAPTIAVSITDPDVSETISSINIYYGVPGSGTASTSLNTVNNSPNLSYIHTIANNTSYYYYLKITQSDGDIIWTSPIWYTRDDSAPNNTPISNFTTSSTSICAGQQITFTDNSTNTPTDWNWSLSGAIPSTSTSQSVVATFPTPGSYTVSLTSSNPFGSSAAITKVINVQVCTGIRESSKQLVKIYPNPANQLLTIDASFLSGEKTIEIVDIQGKLILSQTSTVELFNIELTSLPNGSYFVNVIINKNIYTREHFFIQRK